MSIQRRIAILGLGLICRGALSQAVEQPHLLEPGASPHRVFNWLPKPGPFESKLGIHAEFEVRSNEQSIPNPAPPPPDRVFRLEESIQDPKEDGSFTVGLRMKEVSNGDATPPKQVESMTRPFRDLKTTIVIAPNGFQSGFSSVNASGAVDQVSTYLLSMLRENFVITSGVLPREPFGLGAKWTTRIALRNNQVFEFRFQVDRIESNQIFISGHSEKEMDPNQIPGMKPFADQLEKGSSVRFKVQFDWKGILDLERPLPREMSFDLIFSADGLAVIQGNSSNMNIRMHLHQTKN